MAKIKTTKLEPRAPQGTLTIGTEEGPSTTQFEGTVILPDYATIDYVDHIVAGDIDVELTAYQKRDEKNQNAGYAGLDDTGRVPPERLDTDVLSAEVSEHHDQIATNAAKIEQLESATAFQIEYFMGNKAGTDPAASYMAINANDWENTTQIKINTTDAGGAVHDYSIVKPGDTIWFADVTLDGVVTADVDTIGLYTVDSIATAATVVTIAVTMQSAQGSPTVGDRIECELFPAFDMSSKADVVYVDAQDKWIKDNYLPLSGGTTHKLTGDIYAAQHTVKGIKDAVDGSDAVSRNYGDARYLKQSGDKKMSGDLDMDSNQIKNVGNLEMDGGSQINWGLGDPGGQLAYNGSAKVTLGNSSIAFAADANMNNNNIVNVSRLHLNADREIDVADGTAGLLKYSGDDKLKWGNELWAYEPLSMENNKITKLADPTNNLDAANKKYVDDQIANLGSTPIEVGTEANPPARPKGSMYLTTGGNIYVYT